MARRSLIALTVFAGLVAYAALADAQAVVVPNANAAVSGTVYQEGPFTADFSFVFQMDYAASQFTSVPVGTELTGIGFRLQTGASAIVGSDVFSSYNVTLSESAEPIGALSDTFADNIGPDAELVKSGPLTINGASVPSGGSPNSFFDIMFNTPYEYTGGDLLVTLVHSQGTVDIPVDANTLGDGLADTVGYPNSASPIGNPEFFYYPIVRFDYSPTSSTPEPGSLALFSGIALSGGLLLRRRRCKA